LIGIGWGPFDRAEKLCEVIGRQLGFRSFGESALNRPPPVKTTAGWADVTVTSFWTSSALIAHGGSLGYEK
jgi:hypothetical protein